MNEQNKNSKYTIWFYNLTAKEYNILQSKFPEAFFEVVDIFDDSKKILDMRKLGLLDRPDLIISDIETELTAEIRDVLCESCCGYATVSTKQIITSVGSAFELTDEKLEIPVKKYGKFTSEMVTRTDISIKGIIDICQMHNIQKLQKLTTKHANDTINIQEIEKDFNAGEKSTDIVKKYLFKLAKTLNDYISLKDHYTAGHCERVAMYSEALGIALGMSAGDVEDLILAANLHDIGKIALPDAVITKESSLSDFEFDLMKKHVQLGTHILPTDYFGNIKASIRGHHEKYDGSGYPDGLKGNQIPYFAQILAIADSFDAMTSQRSYNKVKTAEEAFEELRNCSVQGKKEWYNPELVEKFIEVISKSKTIMDMLNRPKQGVEETTSEQSINSGHQYKKGEIKHE